MSKLVWDVVGEREYETGVDKCALFVMDAEGNYGDASAWNGLSGITESPSGAEASPVYANNKKYLNLISSEELGFTIEAYTYPDAWKECDGSKKIAPGLYAGQQSRKPFGLVYRSLIGNDTEQTDHGYKIHFIWNALASPSDKQHSTTNENAEAPTMSWTAATTKIDVEEPGVKPLSSMEIDSTEFTAETKKNLEELEKVIWGSDSTNAIMPTPDEVIAIIKGSKTAATLRVKG